MIAETLIASISALVAIGTYFFSQREARKQEVRQTTFEILRTIIFEDGPIYEANLKFALWCTENREFPNDNIEDSEDAKTVVELLNFFDLIADSAQRKIIDRKLVITHLGGRMLTAWDVFSDYVKARRITLKRPGLYIPFEGFLADIEKQLAEDLAKARKKK